MVRVYYCNCCKEVTDFINCSLEEADEVMDFFNDMGFPESPNIIVKPNRNECYRCMPDAHYRVGGI